MSSLSKEARVAGALYILASVFGVVRLIYIPNKLIVSDNAAATVNNILAHETLFRFGILSDLIGSVIWIFVVLALYRLLRRVDEGVAAVMVILGALVAVPLSFANVVNDAGTLLFARGADFLSVFDQAQREAFAMLFLRLHHHLVLAAEIFWGLWLIPFGLLVYRSRFLPRILGIWLIIGCFGYLALSFTGLMFPGHEDQVFKFAQPATMSELAIMLWLVIVGAKEQRTATAQA